MKSIFRVMQQDLNYMRQPAGSFRSSVTFALLIANVAAFVLEKIFVPPWLYNQLVLSLDGLKDWHLWQLITYQFLHGGLLHLAVNCWVLFLFGREVEWAFGKARFLALYFTSGVVGGLLHAFVALVWPQYFDSPVVGASAGIFGVVAAFAMLYPDRRLTLLLFFIIPLRMRVKSLLWVSLVLSTLGLAFHDSFFGGNVAHAAHLGGILTGLAFDAGLSHSFLEGRHRERPVHP